MFQAMRRIVSSLGDEKVTECTFDRAIRKSFLGTHQLLSFPVTYACVVSRVFARQQLSMSFVVLQCLQTWHMGCTRTLQTSMKRITVLRYTRVWLSNITLTNAMQPVGLLLFFSKK